MQRLQRNSITCPSCSAHPVQIARRENCPIPSLLPLYQIESPRLYQREDHRLVLLSFSPFRQIVLVDPLLPRNLQGWLHVHVACLSNLVLSSMNWDHVNVVFGVFVSLLRWWHPQLPEILQSVLGSVFLDHRELSQYRLRLHTLSNESVYVGDDVRNFRLQGLLDFDRKRWTLLASPRIEHFS